MIHLHNHSYYSYRESFTKPNQIFDKVQEMGSETVAICDSDTCRSYFGSLTEARMREMQMIPMIELYMNAGELSEDALRDKIQSLKLLYKRKTVDEKMQEDLREKFGIESEIGKVTPELDEKMEALLDEMSDRLNGKIRLESGQLKPSKLPFVTDKFKLVFGGTNQEGLNNLMQMFSYDIQDPDDPNPHKRIHVMPTFNDLVNNTKLITEGEKINSSGHKIPGTKRIHFNNFEGIMMMTGFDKTEVSWLLERNQIKEAKDLVLKYAQYCPVWLTLEGHGIERDKVVNPRLVKLYEELKAEGYVRTPTSPETIKAEYEECKVQIKEENPELSDEVVAFRAKWRALNHQHEVKSINPCGSDDIPRYFIDIVAANDTFITTEDQLGELRLFQAMFSGETSDKFTKKNLHMMTDGEMKSFLLETGISEEIAELAIQNTYEYAQMCDRVALEKARRMKDTSEELRAACEKALPKLYPTTSVKGAPITLEEARERMEYELGVINEMGFSEYFIKVKDITDSLYDIGALRGTARGSAGGSIVSYLTGITGVDPLKYGLFFERFLNKSRGDSPVIDKKTNEQMIDYDQNEMWVASPPDIDLDMPSFM